MNPPSSDTSDASGSSPEDFDPNAFHFAQAETPPALRIARAEQVQDPAPGAVRPAQAEPDLMEQANKRRIEAGRRLRELVWRFPDGSARVPLLTSSRWAMYEALRGKLGSDDFAPVLTPEEASSQAWRRRYLEAGVLLFLCLNSADTWEAPRTIEHAGKKLQVEPLVANFTDFLSTIRRWMDKAVEITRMDEAVQLADQLVELTFAAATVRVATGDDEEGGGEDDETAEKKTQLQGGRTGTSPVSAQP